MADPDPWWEAVERDGHRCRVAPFLPDLDCSGSLDIYDPADLDRDDPPTDSAVTVCDGHKTWLRDHHDEAVGLGLIRA